MLSHDCSKVVVKKTSSGVGLFAATDIAKDEIVLVDSVDVGYEIQLKDMLLPAGDSCFVVKKLLTDPVLLTKFKALNLSTIQGVYETPEGDNKKYLQKLAKKYKLPLRDVIELWRVICIYQVTYHYITDFGDCLNRVQLSPYHSCINHSCAPNVKTPFIYESRENYKSGLAPLYAKKDITKGEELTFSYHSAVIRIMNLEIPFEHCPVGVRRDVLIDYYNFNCMCRRCIEESKYK